MKSDKKSNAERQEALRLRKKEAGLKEVRGIYATPEREVLIKRYARELALSSTASKNHIED